MRLISVLIISLFLISCSKEISTVEIIEKKEIDLQMIDAYEKGMQALEEQDGLTAAKKFTEAELLFPQSIWAPRAALMSAYSYFSNNYYSDTIYEIERFLKTYPGHPRTDYAYYLLAVTYYNSIVDESRDLDSILKSKKYFEFLIENYPGTEYAIDANFKLELINEVLASKEMYLARYYFEKEKWIPAINRFKKVVNEYDTTIYVEEALHRLVELHYKLGLISEAEKYAYLLGYNYQSSKWYEASYKILNQSYERDKVLIKDNSDTILKKFKKLFK